MTEMKNRPQAVLFDLDGTLTDTLADIADAMNRALERNGLPGWETDEYRYLVGNGVKILTERAVRDRQDKTARVARDYQEWYETHNRVRTKPYDGIPELLRELNARNIPVCVLSNKPDADTRSVVAFYFPEIRFAKVAGQTSLPVKPDPAGALETAKGIGIPPEAFLYLGDSGVDMQCARAAGMHPVGVLWGFRTADELTQNGAEFLISAPSELITLL